MIKGGIKITLSNLKNVLEVAVEELKTNQKKLSTTSSVDEKEGTEV